MFNRLPLTRLSIVFAATLLSLSATAAPGVLGAMGIGVRDLHASQEFYEYVFGLEVQRTFELGYLDEIVMGFPGSDGAVVVLMHWPNDQTRAYNGRDVKLVFYVEDPSGVIERIRERGGQIDREATPVEAMNGRIIGLGRDPDSYVVEVIGAEPQRGDSP